MDTGAEEYLLLLLADSNLPTGSFVASSGLESYQKHGFGSLSESPAETTINFVRCSIETFARSTIPFVTDAHDIMTKTKEPGLTLPKLRDLDSLYHAMTLNNVTRRASQSQGVALLTLYSKGFAKNKSSNGNGGEDGNTIFNAELVDEFKLSIRRGDSPGHLPICWGILTAALGLSLRRTQYLHLFLHARSLISASVRLTSIGPYAAQQILLHNVRPLVEDILKATCHLHTHEGDATLTDLDGNGPENTWPLGDLLSARHDLQQSRIFNS